MTPITRDTWDPARWPNFTPAEMACKGSGLVAVHPALLDALQAIRTQVGRPLPITSGCRSMAHNANVGGHPRSLHIADQPTRAGHHGCMAVDIACPDGALRGDLFSTAWHRGLSIGWNAKRGFLHLDVRYLFGSPQTSFDY